MTQRTCGSCSSYHCIGGCRLVLIGQPPISRDVNATSPACAQYTPRQDTRKKQHNNTSDGTA